MRIVYVYADNPHEWNCSEWRCAVPARAINRTSRHSAALLSMADFAQNTTRAKEVCQPADVIVVERNLVGPVLSAIQHWKARDKVVIADFDDAYDLMPSSNPSYPYWSQGINTKVSPNGQTTLTKIDPSPLTQFKWGLRLVHGATVPSKRLASDWQAYTQVHHLPNYIDLEKYQNVKHEEHEGVIIGWGGSLSHFQSFVGSGVLTALRRVCKARPQVKVLIAGNDLRILERLSIPDSQKIHHPWVPYEKWSSVLAKFDIGIAPLHGPYDERRSWIKVLEYLVMKIPWVASEGPPYEELRPYGWLVNNDPHAWERVLLDLVDHLPDYKAEAARDGYLFGISQSIDGNVEKIIEIYSKIIRQSNIEVTYPVDIVKEEVRSFRSD